LIEFIVYVWLNVAYDGNPVIVGKFANCEQGIAMAQNMYPEAKAVHCILPEYTPPGGIK